MVVKIKNYLKLRKLRRDALSLLIINSAEIISAFKDVTDLVHSYLGDTAEIQKKLSGCLLYTSTPAASGFLISARNVPPLTPLIK